MSTHPSMISLTPGKRILFLTKDLSLITQQLYEGLNLQMKDLSVDDLERAASVMDEVTFRRVRHVVTENERVLETVRVLRESGPRAIGELLLTSHASMRDDFEIPMLPSEIVGLDVSPWFRSVLVDRGGEHGVPGRARHRDAAPRSRTARAP